MIDTNHSSHEVMGVKVMALTMKEVLSWAGEVLSAGGFHMIATANAEMIMNAQHDQELFHILNEADMVVPDGAGVLWAGDTLGTPFPERVTGADLSTELLKMAAAHDWNVYFLGGAPGVAQKASEKFQELHGAFPLAGCHDGYFDSAEEEKILADIREKGTRLLLVGLGVPKQEKWIARHRDDLGPVLAMGIGGVFDVMSGNLKRAPLWMQHHRLEWAYRLFLQPSRIGRMMAIPKFMRAVKRWKKEHGRV